MQGKEVCRKFCTTGCSAAHQNERQSQSGKASAKYNGNQRVTLILWKIGNHDIDHCRGNQGRNHRFDDDLVTHFNISPDQQRNVHQQIGSTDGDAKQMIKHGGDTGQTTGSDLVRCGEGVDGNGEQKTSKQEKDAVEQKILDFFAGEHGTNLLKKFLIISVYLKVKDFSNTNKQKVQDMS